MTQVVRNMKAVRHVEAMELMLASNNITVAHADALLKASSSNQHADQPPPERDKKTAPIEQIVKLEKEMSQVQTQHCDAEQHYGSDLLNWVVAKGYLTKLLANDAVTIYFARYQTDILGHLELVVNTLKHGRGGAAAPTSRNDAVGRLKVGRAQFIINRLGVTDNRFHFDNFLHGEKL